LFEDPEELQQEESKEKLPPTVIKRDEIALPSIGVRPEA